MKRMFSILVLPLAAWALVGCTTADDSQLRAARKEAQINNAAKAQDELSSSMKRIAPAN